MTTREIDARVGTVVAGRYAIKDRLGEGGMGVVYRAEHLELERPVALKVLAPELARSRATVERFLREAKTASRITHPNIVSVFDLGRTDEGAPFLAMELLEGTDFRQEIEAAEGYRLAPARVVEVLAPIARALDVCHARGVVHRDLKPSNVFLARIDEHTQVPKLLDFGLAMLFASDERLTRTGFFAGTPEYMPPESAHGNLAGPAGDVYALATMAFEALSGAMPFHADLPNGILVQKVTTPAPTMAEASGRTFDAALEAAVAAGLRRDPKDRPPTAAAFVDGIARALGASTAPASPPPAPAPASEVAPRAAVARPVSDDEVPALPANRGPWIAAGVVAVAVIAGAGGWLAFGGADEGTPVAVAAEGTEDGSGAESETGSESETGAESETGSESETGAESETGSESETEAGSGSGSEAGSGSGSEAGSEAESGSEAGSEAESGSEAGSESQAGSESEAEAGSSVALPPAPSPVARPRPSPAPAPTPEPEPARDRGEAERLVRSASSLLLRGDSVTALSMLQRARAADPSYPDLYRSLGLAYQREGRTTEARAAYQRYLSLAPGAPDAARIRRQLATL